MSHMLTIDLTGKNSVERMKEMTDRLESGIQALFESDRFREYLNTMSKFHDYSFNNTLLIAMQKPDATLVAGYHDWKNKFGRHVKAEEKSIKILAPAPYKKKVQMTKVDPDTRKPVLGKDGQPVKEEKEITVPAFRVVSVFDVSQTEGKELPSIAVDQLTGDVDRFKDFYAALENVSPVPMTTERIAGAAKGYYHQIEKRIVIEEGLSQLQTLKTAIHEIAHAKLHAMDPETKEQPVPDRHTKEVQAESVAYTVCQHYGLDTSDYSFGYVAGWSTGRELSELRASMETIRSAAHELISGIDRELAELQHRWEHPVQEAAFRLEGVGYLHIQETDNGYDYTLYDQRLRHTDGGLLDEPEMSLQEACKAILEYHFLEPSAIDDLPLASFARLRETAEKAALPDEHLTGATVQTPRGSFHLTDLSKEQMEKAGYGVHHNSQDGKYHIMGNGTRAFAVRNPDVPEQKPSVRKNLENAKAVSAAVSKQDPAINSKTARNHDAL